MFKKARPFINYSTSWSRKLGQAICLALLEILNIVYSDLLKLQDVHAVLEQIRLLFRVIASDERIFEIHQSDIIWRGFLQPSGTWSDSSSCWFRDLSFLWSAASIFGIFYTDTHSQVGTHTTYFSGSLAISEQAVSRIQTVSYSGFEKKLQNSFFHAGTQVFRQHRGASMGSQWAPILCSAVALMREYNFSRFIPCYCRNHILHIVTLTIELIRRFSASPGNNTFFAVCPISGPLCVCIPL